MSGCAEHVHCDWMGPEDSTTSENARDHFGFIADLGMTEHYASMEATRELVELCGIGDGKYVLDVGCGVRPRLATWQKKWAAG
jgi:hypothetical protein